MKGIVIGVGISVILWIVLLSTLAHATSGAPVKYRLAEFERRQDGKARVTYILPAATTEDDAANVIIVVRGY